MNAEELYYYTGVDLCDPYLDDELMHYGILGMKWGRRKGRQPSNGRSRRRGRNPLSSFGRFVSTKQGRRKLAKAAAISGAAAIGLGLLERRHNRQVAAQRQQIHEMATGARPIFNAGYYNYQVDPRTGKMRRIN